MISASFGRFLARAGLVLALAPLAVADAATVGRPVPVALPPAAPSDPGEVRKEYRRPAEIPFPRDNPVSAAKLALGRALYFDTRLSGSGAQSCASCHNPSFGWGDGLAKGVGDGMKVLKRRSPTVLNGAWGQVFMWDGRAATLEEQALGPIQSQAEMNLPVEHLVGRLKSIPEYARLFEAAFPGEGITPAAIGKAIATFERSLVSGWAPFDSFVDGNDGAISASARRGFDLFNGKARCHLCHSGWRLTDDSFHDIGMPDGDVGRGQFAAKVVKLQHAFKTPGLRNIVQRAPYMHDGSMATLAAVVEHYDRGGVARPSRSDLMRPLGLTAQEKSDLIAFMETLTGDDRPVAAPVLPR